MNKDVIIIKGTVKSAKFGSSKFDDTNKCRLWVESKDIPYDEIHAYDSVGKKLTPNWFKDKDGTINLSSIYDIPVKNSAGEKISFEDWIDSGVAFGATILVSIKQKEGALYPKAIKVIEDGEPSDPFEDFE